MYYDAITIGDATNDIFMKPHEASLIASPQCPPQGVCDLSMICWGFGEKITVDEIYYDVGGSACNVAVGLSRLGYQTGIITALGDDLFAQRIQQQLKKEKVFSNYIKILKNIDTSFSVIITYRGERTILVYHGLDDYSRLSIPRSLKTKWLYIGPLGNNYQPLYQRIISLVSERTISLALNPGAIQIKDNDPSLQSLLRVTKVLFLNKEEAINLLRMPGLPQIKELLIKLKDLGPKIVVVTDGKHGAYAVEENNFYHIPIFSVQKIDVTGAGDAFSSGFLASYIKEERIEKALCWGVINSAWVVKYRGAQSGLLKLSRLRKNLSTAPKIYKI